jgi:hypothetical protein
MFLRFRSLLPIPCPNITHFIRAMIERIDNQNCLISGRILSVTIDFKMTGLPLHNPNGIASFSPGVAARNERLPWANEFVNHYPERVA